MNSFRCNICGYQYNPEEGDPMADIPPGTPFEELPASWRCPVCGVGKDDFEEMV